MAKAKKNEGDELADEVSMDAAPRVVVINRTRSEIVVEAAGGAPIEVVRDGERREEKVVMLPGTPKFDLQPRTTIFRLDDWRAIEENRAVQGLIATGQLEVR